MQSVHMLCSLHGKYYHNLLSSQTPPETKWNESLSSLAAGDPGGVLGPKNDGGVPLAAENWTQKDRGKNEIWGLKDRIL